MNRVIHNMRSGSNHGFTLVELLIVIAIIGILSAIAIPMFLGQRTQALISEVTTNLEICATLQEQYYAENARYAPWFDKTNFEEPVMYAWYQEGKPFKDDARGRALLDYIPQFKPGAREAINFYYIIKSEDIGQGYRCMGKGKAGTNAEGLDFYIDVNGTLERHI